LRFKYLIIFINSYNVISLSFNYIYMVFVFFFQYGSTHIICIESTDIPDELIYHFDTTSSFIKERLDNDIVGCDVTSLLYCKNSVCACVNLSFEKPFIELPAKNGYSYILFPYININIDDYNEFKHNKTINVSINYKNDIQYTIFK